MKSEVMRFEDVNGVTVLRYKIFDKYDFINHAVSTRKGGVSSGEALASLNLGLSTGDNPENILENYKRFCNAAGFDINSAVTAKQTHSDNIRIVTDSDRGKGTVRQRDYDNIDALITDIPGIPLVVHMADCVPVTFADTKNRAVGNAHCGWRGTYKELACKTLSAMVQNYGTNPADVVCAIGPCICGKCYEVSRELYDDFKEKFGFDDATLCIRGKYYLDLALINRHLLERCGVPAENIVVSDICTCCNCDEMYSHRGLGKERGILASIICIGK